MSATLARPDSPDRSVHLVRSDSKGFKDRKVGLAIPDLRVGWDSLGQ